MKLGAGDGSPRPPEAPPGGAIRSLQELVEAARGLPPKTLVIAVAQDEVALEAAATAREEGLARSILVGDGPGILRLLASLGEPADAFEVVHAPEPEEAVRVAVELVRKGEGQILMKGKVTSAGLLKEVLHRERGLRTGRLLSDVFLFDHPRTAPPRLLGITDGGLNLAPDLKAKEQILSNALEVFRRLGYAEPKVAVLSAIETTHPDLPSTLDAAELTRKAAGGAFGPCVVEGPLAMDLALSAEAARRKGVPSRVAGAADILLFPNIEAANITAKALQYLIPFEPAHVVVGAAVPVLIPSRSESARAKANGVALARLLVP